jgi:GxxExxY protein
MESHRENFENELTRKVIGAAIEVHKHLGPGLLESAYQTCLVKELKDAGLSIQSEVALPIMYKDIKLDHGYRIDILVENKLVLELKTVELFTDVHSAQILTYMKLGNYPLGLLINFHVSLLTKGVKRFIL